MSTFGGKIQEIPYISVDRFDGENLDSDVYFLSHCHADHMKGINNYFWDHLINKIRFLYASKISCAILKLLYPNCVNNIKELCINIPSTVNFQNNSLSITSIPAGHCPGSVMFLFITESKNILYTGDYRISKNDFKKIKVFYNNFKQVIKFDKIYLDTTFFSKSYLKFPKREESLDQICKIIYRHINKGREYMIHLITGAYYGYEYVFKKIYEKFNMPVHVRPDSYEFYRLIPDMDASVTMDGSKTQIHCHCDGYKQNCLFCSAGIVQNLVVTAYIWVTDLLEGGISHDDPEKGTVRVCFSTHASFEEGTALIRFLRPKEIEICVLSKDPERNDEMNSIINELLSEIHSPKKIIMEPKLFKTKLKAKKVKRYNSQTSYSSKYHQSSILDSPPREKRLFSGSLPGQQLSSNSPTKTSISRCSSLGTTESSDLKIEIRIEKPVAAFGAILANQTKSAKHSTDITRPKDKEIDQSSQISLEELEISSGYQSGDVILNIINDKSNTNSTKLIPEETAFQPEHRMMTRNVSEDNVILSFIDSQEIVGNDNTSSDSAIDKDSQNVLLDIIHS